MKKLTLSVTVSGGVSVLGIIFKLYKKGENAPILEQTREGSFVYEFENLDGNYYLYVMGSNPLSDNRKSTIQLDYSGITFVGNLINPMERKGKSYIVYYEFSAK